MPAEQLPSLTRPEVDAAVCSASQVGPGGTVSVDRAITCFPAVCKARPNAQAGGGLVCARPSAPAAETCQGAAHAGLTVDGLDLMVGREVLAGFRRPACRQSRHRWAGGGDTAHRAGTCHACPLVDCWKLQATQPRQAVGCCCAHPPLSGWGLSPALGLLLLQKLHRGRHRVCSPAGALG